jgi:HK97 family phage major capsid protein
MKTMTIDQFKDALTKAAKAKGEAGVVAQKKLILEGDFMITDAAGVAVDPEALDVAIRAAAPAMEEDSADTAGIEEKVAKSVRSALGIRTTGGSSAMAVTAEPKAWESAKQYGRLKAFKSKEAAYRFGSFCLAAMGHRKSAQFCANNGIQVKAHSEGVNSAGGFLVPDEFENEIVTLREQYGVFRRNAKIYPMSSDTLRISKRTAGLTAYFVGEINAGTESTQTFDSVQLVAKKLMCLTTVSNELLEDALVNIGDDIANEVAYAFSLKEDDAGFNGTGTSTYGGIVGLAGALTNATYQVATSATTTYASVSKDEISAALAKLPNWAFQRNNVKIYCHKSTYHAIFERLSMAAGGVTATEMANGIAPRYFGYPVEFSQVLPAVTATTGADGDVLAYIGDLSQACFLGDRRSTAIAFSDSALNAFEQDERVVRGTERFDIVCANVGGSTATGAMVKFTL